MSMGNKVAVMFAELPVGEPDPDVRLSLIKAHMGRAKDGKQALGADAIMRLADFAPPTLLSLAGRVVANQWVMNLTVTNVPGPQFPLYFMGGAVRDPADGAPRRRDQHRRRACPTTEHSTSDSPGIGTQFPTSTCSPRASRRPSPTTCAEKARWQTVPKSPESV